jgi:hypothetical protein
MNADKPTGGDRPDGVPRPEQEQPAADRHPADTRGVADYNHDRHSRSPIQPDRDAITHVHAEFKGQATDLYTDGTRWASADTPRSEDKVPGRGEIPPDRLPTGEELVDGASEEPSPLDKFRRELYEAGEDTNDVIEQTFNADRVLFEHPPTGSHTGTPMPGPYFSAQQHSGADIGTGATALFALGLVIERVATFGVQHLTKHRREGTAHAGN